MIEVSFEVEKSGEFFKNIFEWVTWVWGWDIWVWRL